VDAVFPEPDTMRAVLALATRAPSAHNAQPWQWRVTPGAFDLYTDPVALRTAGDDERRLPAWAHPFAEPPRLASRRHDRHRVMSHRCSREGGALAERILDEP
jgi:nitroreductase